MDPRPIHLLRACPDAPLDAIPESRWQAIEEQIHEALRFGIDRFILDLSGATAIHPLDYWMLLNLAILTPAGGLVVVCAEALFTRSLQASRLSQLIAVVPHLADAYAVFSGEYVGHEIGGASDATPGLGHAGESRPQS